MSKVYEYFKRFIMPDEPITREEMEGKKKRKKKGVKKRNGRKNKLKK